MAVKQKADKNESGHLVSRSRDQDNGRPDKASRCNSTHPLTILCYHRVLPEISHNSYYSSAIAVSQFSEQMDYLRRHYEVLPLEEALLRLDAGTLPRRAVSITFDDGYRELMDAAFPVLWDLRLSAMVFLIVEHVGTDLPFWWEDVAFRLKIMDREAAAECLRAVDLQISDRRPDRIAEAINALKAIPNELREKFLCDLRISMGTRLFSRMSLSWEEVRKAQAWGVSFGSHSLTHPILSLLGDAALDREMRVSRETIESMTGAPCSLLAYPHGDQDDRVRAAALRAGYRWAVTMERGQNRPRTNPLALRRHPVYAHYHHHVFAAILRGWCDFPPWVFRAIRAVRIGRS